MKLSSQTLFRAVCFSLFLLFHTNTLLSQVTQDYISNEVIVKFKVKPEIIANKGFDYQKSMSTTYPIENVKVLGDKVKAKTYVVRFDGDQNIEAVVEKYMDSGLFEFVEPNYIGSIHGQKMTPNDDEFFNRQWQHFNDGTFSNSEAIEDADMDTNLAWNITEGDPNLVVAILDSGVKLDHPEFSDRIWTNTDDENFNGIDSDGNGFVDDFLGWDFFNNDNFPSDDNGHGTNVAGIALATGNNSVGIAGVNWQSKIMVCKVVGNDGLGGYSYWIDAIHYAVDNGAKVINMSLGGANPSTALEDAVNYAFNNNVIIVASSGNNNGAIGYPGRYIGTLAVGSTSANDTRTVPFPWSATSGSNFGPELDFVAPGNYIYGPKHDSNTDYNTYWSGTSQAAPQVTGIVSLLLSVNPNLSFQDVLDILIDGSEDQVGDAEDVPGWDPHYGFGRVNAFNSLALIDPNGFEIHARAYLEGPYDANNQTMFDEIRAGGYLPNNEPYGALGFNHTIGGDEYATASTFAVTGNDAIVDWLFMELRDGNDPTNIIATQSVLLQRDGDIVGADGVSNVVFHGVDNPSVYIALRHRNHFGVRTQTFFFTSLPIFIDFSNPAFSVYEDQAMLNINGIRVMVSGDANNDGQINAADKNDHWRNQNAEPYNYYDSDADFNMDTGVNVIDINAVWRINNARVEGLD